MQIKNNSKIQFTFRTKDGKSVLSSVGSTVDVDGELTCSRELIDALESVGFEFGGRAGKRGRPKKEAATDAVDETVDESVAEEDAEAE